MRAIRLVQSLDFFGHEEGDAEAVAVSNLEPAQVSCAVLSGTDRIVCRGARPGPLGHKRALTDIGAGDDVEFEALCRLPITLWAKQIRKIARASTTS